MLVARACNGLVAGWYSAAVGCVLPHERSVVSVTTAERYAVEQGNKGYWFIPQIYLTGSYSLATWLGYVRWKSLSGFGIDCVAWLREPDASAVAHVSLDDVIQQLTTDLTAE